MEWMKRLKVGPARRSKLIFYLEDLSGITHMLNIEAKQEYTMGMNIQKLCPRWGSPLQASYTSVVDNYQLRLIGKVIRLRLIGN